MDEATEALIKQILAEDKKNERTRIKEDAKYARKLRAQEKKQQNLLIQQEEIDSRTTRRKRARPVVNYKDIQNGVIDVMKESHILENKTPTKKKKSKKPHQSIPEMEVPEMLRPCSFNPFDVSLPSPLIPSIPMSEPLSPQIPSIPMSMSPSPKQSTLPEITASLSVPEIPSAISPDQPQEPSLQAISDSDEEMDLPLEPEEPESPPIHPSLEDEPHLPRLFTNSDDDEPRNPMPSVSNSEIPRPSTQPSLEDSPEEPAEAANDFPPPSSPSFEPPEQFSDPSQSPAVSNSNPSPSPHASNSIESLPQMVVLDTDDDEESQSQHVHSVQRTLLRTGRLVSFESRSVMNEFGSPKNTMDARPPSPSPELLDDPVPDPAVDVQCLSSDSDSAPDSDEPIGNIELPELPAFLDVPIVMDPKVPVVDLGPQLELPQLAEMVPPDQLVIPDLPQDSLHVPPLPVIQEPEVIEEVWEELPAELVRQMEEAAKPEPPEIMLRASPKDTDEALTTLVGVLNCTMPQAAKLLRNNANNVERSIEDFYANGIEEEVVPVAPLSEKAKKVGKFVKWKIVTEETSDECPICLDELFGSGMVVVELPCLHSFHGECIAKCTKSNKLSCSCCRKVYTEPKKPPAPRLSVSASRLGKLTMFTIMTDTGVHTRYINSNSSHHASSIRAILQANTNRLNTLINVIPLSKSEAERVNVHILLNRMRSVL